MVKLYVALALITVLKNNFVVTGSSHPKKVEYTMEEIGTLGIRKSGTVINILGDIALSACTEFCVDKTDCIAFNYDTVLRTCEALASVNESDVKSENNLFVTDLTWTKRLDETSSRPCAAKPCNGMQRCIDMTDSGHECVINECNYPEVREGMKLYGEIATKIGATARYECQNYLNESYRFSPPITCQTNGSWTDITFHCKCGTPQTIYRANIDGTERRTGGTIQYTCNTNYYKPSGDPNSTCLSSGQWSSTNFKCLNGWKCSFANPCWGYNLKYTSGKNKWTPGCGNCWCCRKI